MVAAGQAEARLVAELGERWWTDGRAAGALRQLAAGAAEAPADPAPLAASLAARLSAR